MKKCWYRLSIFVFCLQSLGCSTNINKKATVATHQRDSSYQYLLKAKNTSLTVEQRLNLTNQALSFLKEEKGDSVEIALYSLRNALYSKTSFGDSALYYARKMLKKARQVHDTTNIGKAFFKLAYHYEAIGLQDSAYYYFSKSLGAYKVVNDSVEIGRKLTAIARLLSDVGDFTEGEYMAVEAVKYLVPHKDQRTLSSTYHTLAIIDREQEKFENAIDNISKAIELAVSPMSKLVYLNTRALIYREMGNYETAIEKLQQLLTHPEVKNSRTEYARILDNLTYTQWLNGDANVLAGMKEALRIKDSLNDISSLIPSYKHFTEYYAENQKKKAVIYANTYLTLAQQKEAIPAILDALKYLGELAEDPGVQKEYFKRYIALNDSIVDARDKAKNKYAQMRYDNTRTLQENLVLKNQRARDELTIQKEQNMKTIYKGIILLLLLIGVFSYYIIKERAKREKEKKAYEAEAELSKRIHDELANEIYQVMAYLQRENQNPTDQTLDKLEIIYSKARDISRETNSINTGEDYEEELRSLLEFYAGLDVRVSITGLDTIKWKKISSLKKMTTYRVLQELMINMRKHSHATLVLVKFSRHHGYIHILYSDNGHGLSMEQLVLSNGLQNAETRIKGINGTLTFETNKEKGFKVLMSFPV